MCAASPVRADNGCDNYTPTTGDTVTCSSAFAQSTSGVQTAINNTGNNNVTVNIDQTSVRSINGSTVGIGSNSTVTNAGSLNTQSFTNGYGISFGANGRSRLGGNAVVVTGTGSVTTAGYNADAIRIDSSALTSAANSVTNQGILSTSGTNSEGISIDSRRNAVTVANSGSILTSGSTSNGIDVVNTGSVVSLTNAATGVIRTSGTGSNGVAINGATTITNAGMICAGTVSGGQCGASGNLTGSAILLSNASNATASSITNQATGIIATGRGIAAIQSSAGGLEVMNYGLISGGGPDPMAVAFAQGAGKAANALTLYGGSSTVGAIAFNLEGTAETLAFSGFSNGSFGNAVTGANVIRALSGSNVAMTAASYSLGAGTVEVDGTSALEIAGAIVDSTTGTLTSLTKTGAGTLTLSSDSTYSGGTTIAAGTLQLGEGGTTGSILGNVANGGTLAFNRSNGLTFGGIISGSGAVQQIGSGTTTLTADNTYTGGTTIAAGTLQLGDGGTTGSIVGNVANNGTLVFNRSNDIVFDGVISGSGALQQVGTGTTTLTAANTYTGATAVGSGALMLLGSITSDTSVAAGATLVGTGTITGDVSNSGTIAPGTASGIGTFTIAGSYVGNGGTLQTRVGGEPSAPEADVLRITGAGNTASGSTAVTVIDKGGLGAPTRGDGILVVDAANGATTSSGAFVLGQRVAAGAYEYNLVRGGSSATQQSWYLSTYEEQPVPPGPTPGPDPEPQADPQPSYRVETANYTALPALQRLYTYSLVDTLEQRRGALGGLEALAAQDGNALWGRAGGAFGDTDGSGSDGLDLSYDFGFLQAGVDAIAASDGMGGRVNAGVFLALGQSRTDTSTGADGNTGNADVTAYSAGLYGTWLAAHGFYGDLLGQVTRFANADASSSGGQSISTGGWSQSLSLEAGYRVALGEHASLTPQGQIIAENFTLDGTSDDYGDVDFGNGFAARGRLGLELGSQLGGVGRQTDVTLRASVWHVFADEPETTFSTLDGSYPVGFEADIGTTWLALDAGLSTAVTDNASLFANASYEYGFNDTRQSGTGRIGIAVNW